MTVQYRSVPGKILEKNLSPHPAVHPGVRGEENNRCPATGRSVVILVFVVHIRPQVLITGRVPEIIFNRPGLGSLIVGSMLNRDYITINSIMTVYAAIVIFINLITDLSYGLIDPRIRYE